MTSKQRLLTAIRREVPDRVPVAPDISNYIPLKRIGLPFWDIYFFKQAELWKLYLEAASYYGIDPWLASCTMAPFLYESIDYEEEKTYEYMQDKQLMVERCCYRTPAGDTAVKSTCFADNPPWPIEKPIKDIVHDLGIYKSLRPLPTAVDWATVEEMKRECAERDAAFGVTMLYPGFHIWHDWVQGGVETLSYAEFDAPEAIEAMYEYDVERGDRELDLILDMNPDYLLFGGSGTITLASPELARKYPVPALKKWTQRTKAAGIPTMLHSCGKSRVLVDLLAEETEVDMINPLEAKPMGDIDLAEVKQARGHQIGLMGNLHTSEVMLRGTPDIVRREALRAMKAAGKGGGFILSTGDQCGRETPDENILALVEVVREFGVYDRATGALPALDNAQID